MNSELAAQILSLQSGAHQRAAEALRRQAEKLDILNRLGATLAAEHDLDRVVQSVTDAGRELTGGAFGAFFYNVKNEKGEGYMLYTLSGAPREAFEKFPMPRNTEIFGPTFRGEGVVRIGDVLQDPRYGKNPPYHGMPEGHLPVRSYLAAAVVSRSGEVLGGLFFGHPKPDVFTPESEQGLISIAAQAAIAIDNARLYQRLQEELASRKADQERLREVEQRFEAILENSSAIIYVKDREGKYLLVNGWFEKLFGFTREEIIGKTDLDVFPDDFAQKIQQNDVRVLTTGQPLEIEETTPHADGLHTYLSVKFPLRKPDGSVYAIAGISTDITIRKQAEMASRRLAAIVESSDDAIISKDLNGVIVSWNQGAERIFGYTAEEVVGKPITILFPADRQSEEPHILNRIRSGQRIDHYETVRQRKDGTLLDISLTVSPVKDASGKIVGASKIARDITGRKQVERALAVAQAELSRANEELETRVQQRTKSLREAIGQMEEFSYSVSHDLRSPVRAMQGYARAVLEDFGDCLPGEGKEYLERIVRSSSRMDRLIQDVLTYSRLSRREISLQIIDLDHLVTEIVEQYPDTHQRHAEIKIEHPLTRVIGHEASLTQAFSNLLNNAVKFVGAGITPQIEIGTERHNGRVRLWIRDNGIGIKPEYQHRLFGLFERIHPEKEFEGTGIGLAIVRKATERMGGAAGVESDGMHGSRFWIELDPAP